MNSLRLTTSDGVVVREPDRAGLRATVEAAAHAGCGAFVVLDGDTAGDAPFLQAVHLGHGRWQVEVWRVAARSSAEHYRTTVPDTDTVVAVFWSWADGGDDWQYLRWEPLTTSPLAAAG
ncbi:hypothetical protein SAMN05443575_3557 [Jatrophihabitans endophyticus]|uniref:Uncharacterized protein n=1 Tax=Jatrophihabitans endophyticus TaxID=1206085 RepID=A0A1M5RJJ4_9ACTN|nr:hypothetical protein [Jatrophihabitans endophyticus]SHH25953.1 hypothetical protein SAMN05443575_3557 [Jatrophihabitans endophyticus]